MAAFDPVSWLVSLAGFVYDWLLSRSWTKIVLGSVPFFLLVSLIALVWIGGRLDPNSLADKYLEIGTNEIDGWEENLFSKLTSTSTSSGQGGDGLAPDDLLDAELNTEQKESLALSPFGEMLFRRLELLRPSSKSQFVIGTNLLMRGGLTQGQSILRKIAPEDSKGDPKAHAILAVSYLTQYANSQDPQLLPLLQHHADAASEWPNTPKDVLLLAIEMNWQRRNFDRSLELLGAAAERFPELYPVLYQRAGLVSKNELAEIARQKAIVHLEGLLEAEPKNDTIRVQLAQMLGINDGSLEKIEQLLKAGIELESTPNLTRALSEVYRIRFVRLFLESEGKTSDYTLLERALEIDPGNTQVVEQVARLIRDGGQPTPALRSALEAMLASGEASVGTHAVLSEYYLAEDRRPEAISHLEKVFQAAPTEVKFANNLAYLYADQDRLEEAQQVARTCLELLQQNNMQNQRFVDELLDTLGMIYQRMEKTSDAISSFELALRFNPDRIDSRERLAALYREMGNEGVAVAHEQAIQAIKQAQEEKQKTESNTPQEK